MLQLNLTNTPEWLDLDHGVRVLVAPMSTAVMIAARRDPRVAALGDQIDALNNDDLALVMAKAVARIAITDWDGIGDAEGKPVSVTPEGVDALLEVWPLFEAFQTKYVNSGFLLAFELLKGFNEIFIVIGLLSLSTGWLRGRRSAGGSGRRLATLDRLHRS